MSNLAPGRQSPFRRQPSTNTAPPRASTPTSSPTKPSLLSPARQGSLPPERSSPFARQPSQNDLTARSDNAFRREGSLSPTKEDNSARGVGNSPSKSQLDTPVKRFQNNTVASPSPSIASSVDGTDVFDSPSTQILHGHSSPAPVNTTSHTAKVRQPTFEAKPAFVPKSNNTYNSIPAPLLRSFRESFEVLDPNATGMLNSSSLPPVLDQLGLSNEASLNSFFPQSKQNINLATYLDQLSAPFGDLSSAEELAAAFSAFDIDDSGQIDVHDLREAVLRTMPEPGEVNQGARLSEAEVDSILQSFTGRRAFGARGLGAQKNGRGEVFKWRDFVGSLGGGIDDRVEAVAA